MKPGRLGQPALLLDRDGVINHDHGYVGCRDRFQFCDGIFALGRRAVDLGYRLVVVTNQSGIARGRYPESQFQALSAWMAGEFARHGAALAAIGHCPYLPDAAIAAFARDSFWRKPAPGMILEAARLYDLDLARSVLLGDQPTDMAAAAAAGVGWRVLITRDSPSPTLAAPAHLVIHRLEELTVRLRAVTAVTAE